MRTPGANFRYRLSGASASNQTASSGSAVSLPTPSPRSLVLAERIQDAEFRVERGRQIVARQRELTVNCAGSAGISATTLLETCEKDPTKSITPAVEKTTVDVSLGVGALQQRATSLFTYRLERRCQAVVQSDAFFKTMVIGGGSLPVILTMLALSAD